MRGRRGLHDSMAKVGTDLSSCHILTKPRIVTQDLCTNLARLNTMPCCLKESDMLARVPQSFLTLSKCRPYVTVNLVPCLVHPTSYPSDMRLLSPLLRIQITPRATPSMGGQKGRHRSRVRAIGRFHFFCIPTCAVRDEALVGRAEH